MTDQELRDEFEKINKGNDFSTIMDCGNLKYWDVVVNNDWIQFKQGYSLAQETIKAKDAEIESIRKELETTSIRRGYELIKQKNKSITEAILILDEIVDARNISCGNYEKAMAWLENNR